MNTPKTLEDNIRDLETFLDYFSCGVEAENQRIREFFEEHNLLGLLDEEQKDQLFNLERLK